MSGPRRTTERNAARPRLLATQAGDVELRIPKLRKGSFFLSILEPRRREALRASGSDRIVDVEQRARVGYA